MIDEVAFAGHGCARVSSRTGTELLITLDKGPRIISFTGRSGINHLAVLPGSGIETPVGRFSFHGGHRLWVAPEIPTTTHLPDDSPCRVDDLGDALRVTAPDNGSGLERSITISVNNGSFAVDHVLTNVGERTIGVASWAITQFPLQGTAIVPFPDGGSGNGFQATHALVLWPYTRLSDPRLTYGDHHILVTGIERDDPCKLGVSPGPTSLGYLRAGQLFVKRVNVPNPPVPDFGASAQVYTAESFLELESLGTLTQLGPGQSTGHRETWESHGCGSVEAAIDRMQAVASPSSRPGRVA